MPPAAEAHDDPAAGSGWTAAVAALLRQPGRAVPAAPLALLVVAGAACYGFAAGFFQGDAQLLWSAVKAPLVVAAGLLLCLPSFVVFHLVSGTRAAPGELARTVLAFGAVAALFLAALAPVGWLFSLTSGSLVFVVLFHLAIWGLALVFGVRHLLAALPQAASRGVSLLWSVLFWFVAVQLAAYLGPMLWRPQGEEVFPLRRGSFLVRFGDVLDEDERRADLPSLERPR